MEKFFTINYSAEQSYWTLDFNFDLFQLQLKIPRRKQKHKQSQTLCKIILVKMKNWKNGSCKMHQRHHLETWLHQILTSSNTAWNIKWFCGSGRMNIFFRNIRLIVRCSFYTKQHQTSFSYFLAIFLLQHRRRNPMFMLFAHHNTSLTHRLH